MILHIQADSPVPIFEQIVNQVIFAVAAGDVAVGEMIPSVRELAHKALVHPNTVAKAVQELERLGVVRARRGVGMEVTEDGPESARSLRRERVRGRLRAALREAVASALSADEVRRLVDEEFALLTQRDGAKPTV